MGGADVTLLTVKEVAAVLRVSPQTVYLMVKRGELPAFRVGSQWRFDADKLNLESEHERPS